MPLEPLCCNNLGDLDGGIARHIIDREIRRAVDDFDNRASEDDKPRKVLIQITITPHKNMTLIEVEAQAKLPPMRTGSTDAKIRQTREGFAAEFQSHNPERADQPSLEDHLPKDEETE